MCSYYWCRCSLWLVLHSLQWRKTFKKPPVPMQCSNRGYQKQQSNTEVLVLLILHGSALYHIQLIIHMQRDSSTKEWFQVLPSNWFVSWCYCGITWYIWQQPYRFVTRMNMKWAALMLAHLRNILRTIVLWRNAWRWHWHLPFVSVRMLKSVALHTSSFPYKSDYVRCECKNWCYK